MAFGRLSEAESAAIVMIRRMSANSGVDGFELWQDDGCVHVETRAAVT
jgi:hypothetical protein